MNNRICLMLKNLFYKSHIKSENTVETNDDLAMFLMAGHSIFIKKNILTIKALNTP